MKNVRWREIEEEYGEPIRDVLVGLREGPPRLRWEDVGAILGVSLSGLYKWRVRLGLEIGGKCARFPDVYTPTDRKAQGLGYDDATDAVTDLRLVQGKTVVEASVILHVAPRTITEYSVPEARVYNLSEAGLAKLRRLGRETGSLSKGRHPWQGKVVYDEGF